MALTLNDRDLLLESTAVRLVQVASNFIALVPDYSSFDVVNGVATPSFIQVTALLQGQLKGTPVFSVVSGSTGITQEVINGNSVATVLYTSLIGNSVVIRATLTYLGTTYTQDIEIAGQTVRPGVVQDLTAEPFGLSAIKLEWQPNIDADLAGYEVRDLDTNWGTTTNVVFRGQANSCTITGDFVSLNGTWYVRAYDTSGLYSVSSAQVSYVPLGPPDVSAVTYEYADTSLTNATVTLKWDPVSPTFGLKEYEITYPLEPDQTLTTLTTRTNSIVLPANWLGIKNFIIKTRDNLGNTSAGYIEPVVKRPPNPVLNFTALGIDSMVQLRWRLPEKTDLPISHVIIKKGVVDSTWETAQVIGIKDGEFTTDQEYTAGTYTYWIVAVDTDGNESDHVSIPVVLTGSSDFIFTGEFESEFNGTLVNGLKQGTSIIVPVLPTETYQQHFVNNSWATPSDQIAAKYPLYIQPGAATAEYEEVFDYGNGSPLILASSTINVAISGQSIIGTTTLGVTISTSVDGITYNQSEAGTSMVGVNFRFVRVRIVFTRGPGDGVINAGSLYQLNSLKVTLSNKLKTDAGAEIIDSAGSFINFNLEFIDVSSINITASGVAPRICTYDFDDEILVANYSISSGTLTATLPAAHGMVTGQRVRLSSGDGKVSTGVYTILSTPTTTQFTVAVDKPDGSAVSNLYIYQNSMFVYVYDTNGTPQTQKVSWTVRGV
jgi:hypothetical protein